MKIMNLTLILAASVGVATAADPVKNDWPRFRGPTGDGLSPANGIPTTWSTNQNVLWSVDLPKAFKIVLRDIVAEKPADLKESGSPSDWTSKAFNPFSSPIVSGGRVFVATSGIRTSEHELLCFDLSDGKFLWKTGIPPGPAMEMSYVPQGNRKYLWKDKIPSKRITCGYNITTPCTDGERVYVTFGSGVIAAVDFQGNLLWHKTYVDLRGREQWKQPIPIMQFAYLCLSTSPVLYKDMVIMVCDPGYIRMEQDKTYGGSIDDKIDDNVYKNAPSFIKAFDGKTGESRYSADRPGGPSNWSTPILVPLKDKTVLMHKNSEGLLGFDPANGKIIWTAKCRPNTKDGLVYGNGMLFTREGRANNIALSVDAESTGDITRNVAWQSSSTHGLGGYSSPVIMDGVIYQYVAGRGHTPRGSTESSPLIGKLYCLDMKTGKELHVLDMPGFPNWSSPVGSADGYLYFASGTKSYVIETGPNPEVVAVNNLGDYNPASSPALTDGKLIIRGSAKLWCIGTP